MTFKLGLKPPTYDARDRLFATYTTARLAARGVPAEFGNYQDIVPGGWGLLANDTYADCVSAGQGHATMLYTAEGGHPVNVTAAEALTDYFAMNGVPQDIPGSASDQGTDPRVGLQYHRNVGMLDRGALRHKLAGYVSLEVGNLHELAAATWLFGVAGVGFDCPQSALDQFPSGYWRVVPGSPSLGGHWVVCVGRWNGYFEIISWGRRVHVTPQFLSTYMVVGFGMLSPEVIGGSGRSPEGFNFAQLTADLPTLRSV